MTLVDRLIGSAVFRLLLLLLLIGSQAQAERLPIKTYTTADGLPRDYIRRIVQDSRGFLWFCTAEGLSRFDGYRFTNYGCEQGLAGRMVNDFLEARDGTYWAATDKGLCRFLADPPAGQSATTATQKFVVYNPQDKPTDVEVLYEDQAGTIWCGTLGGLYRLARTGDDWSFIFVDLIQPVPGTNTLLVQSIIEDRAGSLWVGAESGLYRRRPDGVVEHYTAEEGLPKEPVARALLEDREGRIWVGTSEGLYQFVPDPKPHHLSVAQRYTEKDGLATNGITALCQSANGKLWVGTGIGLSEFIPGTDGAGGRFQSYSMANGLSDTRIVSLAEDRDHSLWIGSSFGGVMRLASSGFTTYDRADGLGGQSFGSIFKDRDGQLIFADAEAHLNRFDGRRFAAFPIALPKGLTYRGWGWYQVLFQDSRRDWWLPTGEGLVRYPELQRLDQIGRQRPKSIYTTRDGLPNNEIFRLFEDSRGNVWVSTMNDPHRSLTRWERSTQTFHSYSYTDGSFDSAPTAFCEDASGNLWIGFYGGGLARYARNQFTFFSQADGVPPGLVRGLYLDQAGRLWAATSEGGVARIDDPAAERPHLVTYSTADGLTSNQATCVTEDQWGMIYIGTGRGVDKLDPATGHIKHFTTADGLASSFINVSLRAPDGSLWFGTLQGLSRYTPQVEPPGAPPSILINTLRLAGLTYPLSELGATEVNTPELEADQNHVEIDFVGLSLGSGESLRYQFKLEGTTGDWSAPSEQRSVNYPNLPPGVYRFLVRAVSADGTASTTPATVRFRVLAPIWQRWWFVLLTLMFISIPVIVVARSRYQHRKAVREAEEAVRRSREERLVELEQVRRRIARDLHDDIGSSLSQIYLLSEVARQRVDGDGADLIEPLRLISSASNEMVSSMSDIVWAINPQKDHLNDLTYRMRRFASDTLAARDITFRFSAPEDGVKVRLGANLRREIFLIFKESVNNLIKHSGCRVADIEFQVVDEALVLRVSDDGRGFDLARESDGHGVMSMKERAASIGGRLELTSEVGRGTTLILQVPLAQLPSLP
jgi:ligand-binding sensor domain-containing protein/signal transduction histidine kinase